MRTGKENTFFNATSINKIPTGLISISDNPLVKVDVYPNPFHNETNIVINSTMLLTQGLLSVYTIDGRKEAEIKIGGNGIYKLNLASLSAGTYIWSLTEKEEDVAHGKWVVQ
jgi:hypothetical protein